MWRELKEANRLQTEQIKEINSRYPSVKKEIYHGTFVYITLFLVYSVLDIIIFKTTMFWMDIMVSVFLAALFIWVGYLRSKYQDFYKEVAVIFKWPNFKPWHCYLGAIISIIVGFIMGYIDIIYGF
jgi:hypothetical protein